MICDYKIIEVKHIDCEDGSTAAMIVANPKPSGWKSFFPYNFQSSEETLDTCYFIVKIGSREENDAKYSFEKHKYWVVDTRNFLFKKNPNFSYYISKVLANTSLASHIKDNIVNNKQQEERNTLLEQQNQEKKRKEEERRLQEQQVLEKKRREEQEAEKQRKEKEERHKKQQEAANQRKREKKNVHPIKNQPETVSSQIDPSNLPKYFDGYNDIRLCQIGFGYYLEPLRPENNEKEVIALLGLRTDKATALYMEGFYGPNAEEMIRAYLFNTYMTTEMGIAFGFAIKKGELGVFRADLSGDNIAGFIKITGPAFNVVTHNFDGWLIDYAMLPAYRNKGVMKIALSTALSYIEDFDGIKKIYAMVDPTNVPSIRALLRVGFKDTKKLGGINPKTNKPSLLLCYNFEEDYYL